MHSAAWAGGAVPSVPVQAAPICEAFPLNALSLVLHCFMLFFCVRKFSFSRSSLGVHGCGCCLLSVANAVIGGLFIVGFWSVFDTFSLFARCSFVLLWVRRPLFYSIMQAFFSLFEAVPPNSYHSFILPGWVLALICEAWTSELLLFRLRFGSSLRSRRERGQNRGHNFRGCYDLSKLCFSPIYRCFRVCGQLVSLSRGAWFFSILPLLPQLRPAIFGYI